MSGRVFVAVLRRDVADALQHKQLIIQPLVFFGVVVSLFPLALGPSAALLAPLSAGLVWVAVLLATLLNMQQIFARDYVDGSLQQMLLAPQPLEVVVLGKVCAHWLSVCLPLLVLAPLLAAMLNLPPRAQPVLVLGLLLGTPGLSLVGAFGAALTLGLRHSGLLLPLLVLPLFVPVLVFGCSAVNAVVQGLSPAAPLLFLAAGMLFAVCLLPFGIAYGLRLSVG